MKKVKDYAWYLAGSVLVFEKLTDIERLRNKRKSIYAKPEGIVTVRWTDGTETVVYSAVQLPAGFSVEWTGANTTLIHHNH
jgi:hypothetical protein|tara:strand:- start:388 stop:630 length:243 start_codon:yes stop_codon:yes gene_type:complete